MKIIIVDDDYLVGTSLKTILEAEGGIEVAAVGRDGTEAISLYEEHNPDVLLMDIQMQELGGLEAAEDILRRHPEAKILLLTTFSDDEYIVKAIRLGAKGYILKQNFEALLPAIHAVMGGQTVFGEEIINKLPTLITSGPDKKPFTEHGLSDKEMDIVRLVADGLNNKEIANELFLGEGTVRNYISTILEKLNLRDRTQLAVFYYKRL